VLRTNDEKGHHEPSLFSKTRARSAILGPGVLARVDKHDESEPANREQHRVELTMLQTERRKSGKGRERSTVNPQGMTVSVGKSYPITDGEL